MKTILDNFHEVSLVAVLEDEHGLRCEVLPMTVDSRQNVVEDSTQKIQLVDFGLVSGYLVVPEIVQAGLDIKYSDSFVISEVFDSTLLRYFGFDIFGKAKRHLVLRTSHQFVNVFVDSNDSESMEKLRMVCITAVAAEKLMGNDTVATKNS